MKFVFAAFAVLLLSSPVAAQDTLDWQTEAKAALKDPAYRNSFIRICVEIDGVSDGCVEKIPLGMAVQPHSWTSGWGFDEEVMPKWKTPDGKPEAGDVGGGGKVPDALDKVLNKVGKITSVRGKVKVHYEERTTNKDGSVTEKKLDMELEAGMGEGAKPAPVEEKKEE